MLCSLRCSAAGRRPNVVFILADDLGWGQLGCYGSDFYLTPNIDRLAFEGMRFTNAYAAAPVCSPTRASIMTGKYPARLHLTDFIKGGDPPEGSRLDHPDWRPHLPLEEVTLAEALKAEGYATAYFGKWHLSEEKTPPQSLPLNPDKQGFDESFVTYKPSQGLAREWQTPEGDGHNVELITGKALDFLDRHSDGPFFLFLGHNTIHNPLMESEGRIARYRDAPGAERPENHPVIAAMLERLDESVGAIVERLETLELGRDTVVVFFSDNGGLEKEADQTPLRSGKASLYEGGIRVPMIVRWPGKVRAGAVCHEPVCSIDFFPTLLALAGSGQPPENIDGISLVPHLMESKSLPERALFWHYPHYHSAGEGPCAAIRRGDYKLIEWYEKSLLDRDGAVELYYLASDVSESRDLSREMPDRAREMLSELNAWRNRVNAQLPEVRKSDVSKGSR